MARGYYVSKGNKQGTLYFAIQSRIIEYDAQDPFMRRNVWGIDKSPGLYRAKFNYSEGHGAIQEPVVVPDEIVRLTSMLAKPAKRRAFSQMPGIAGMQHRADAAASAQEQRRYETGLLRDLLVRLAGSM